mgnify:CR=1 FL=1
MGRAPRGAGPSAQGGGDVSATAIECPVYCVDRTFPRPPDISIQAPRARTAEGWLTFGLDEDLDAALDMALVGMLDLMQEQYGLGRAEALALASVVVDMRVTQIVNGVRGVHAVLPYGALTMPPS